MMNTKEKHLAKARQKSVILGVAILAIVLAVLGVFWFKSSSHPSAVYKEATVSRGSFEVRILSTGVVQPENRLEIKSPVAGRVEEILVKEGQRVRRGQVLVRMSSTERAALLDSAREQSESEMKKWEDYYKPASILAPLDGMIILRNIEPGQSITSADVLLAMSDRLTVKAQVDETDIAMIKVQQKATIVLDAYSQEGIDAVVDQIAFEAKNINNVTTYIVDVLPKNPPAFMRSGMTANVNFNLESRENVLLIPTEAIRTKDGKTYVLTYSTEDSSKTTERIIELGTSDGKKTEVVSGLSEGEIILLSEIEARALSKGRGLGNPFSAGGSPRPRSGSH